MTHSRLSSFLILLAMISTFAIQAQSDFHPKTIIFKLKAENAHLATNDGISNIDLNNYLGALVPYAYERLFPMHQTPQNTHDEYGNELVDLSLIYQFKYTSSVKEQMVVQHLIDFGLFEYVCLRPLNQLLHTPDDSLIGNQYHLALIKAYEAWDIQKGDSTVIIGITDTGTDRTHEDLQNIAYNMQDTIDGIDNDNDGFIDNYYGWDVGGNDNEPQFFPTGHGIFTTGFAAATTNNGIGIAGAGYNTPYLPVKIDDTTGFLVRDYEGIVYAADHFCDIINCSWGGYLGSPFGQDIVNYATFNRNSLVVAAGGNSYNPIWLYPASFDNVLSVVATNQLDEKWIGSSWGTKMDLSAPGQSVYSSWPYDVYFASSGTSFSAPQVAGAAALVKARFPNFTALQIGEQLRVSCDNIDTVTANIPYAGMLGSGRLNMYKALMDTISPSVRLRNTDIRYTLDSIVITSEFVNYLRPTSSAAYAVLRSNSPHLMVVDSIFTLPNLGQLSSIDNNTSPFRILKLASAPNGYQHDVAIHFYDTAYHGLEYIRLEINPDYVNLDTNLIKTTVTSISRLAFTSEDYSQGIGFTYKNTKHLFTTSGFIIGNSSTQVSDNIYNDQGGYDADFVSQQKAHYVIPAVSGDQHINTGFSDLGAGSSALGVFIKEKAYAYNLNNHNNYIILDFTIYNQGFLNLSNVYMGYYINWSLGLWTKNKGVYDSTLNLAITYASNGDVYTGIQGIDGKLPKPFQMTNNGSDSSFSIYDGFGDYEKYEVLSTRKDSAGFHTNEGTDVSSVVSFGPYDLAVGDTAHVVFAILAADHLADLKNAAQAALDTYYYVDDTKVQSSTFAESFKLYPNPTSDQLHLEFESADAQDFNVSIYDVNGKLVHEQLFNSQLGYQHFMIDVEHLKSGFYTMELKSKSGHLRHKFVRM